MADPNRSSRTWWACEEPERPTDPYVRWHYRDCLGCRVKGQALAMQHPDDPHVAWLNGILVTPID